MVRDEHVVDLGLVECVVSTTGWGNLESPEQSGCVTSELAASRVAVLAEQVEGSPGRLTTS